MLFPMTVLGLKCFPTCSGWPYCTDWESLYWTTQPLDTKSLAVFAVPSLFTPGEIMLSVAHLVVGLYLHLLNDSNKDLVMFSSLLVQEAALLL